MTVAAVVLAAGGSRRLGRPKQLLDLDGRTVLDAVLATVRAAGFDQVVVALGGAADEIRRTVDLTDLDVVVNPDYGSGCGSSVAAALSAVRPGTDGLVLVLGDQPELTAETVERLRDAAAGHLVGVCRYDDGRGHPLWFGRGIFRALAGLRGDKAVWKLVEAADSEGELVEVAVPGSVPPDVDTEADYRALLGRLGREVPS